MSPAESAIDLAVARNAGNHGSISGDFQPGWRGVLGWLVVFLSPTGYVLALMMMASWQLPVPAGVVVTLFFLVPVVALVACGTSVWRSTMSWERRAGGLVITALGILLQFGFWTAVIASMIAAMISLA